MKLLTSIHSRRQHSRGALLFAVGLGLAALQGHASAAVTLTGTSTFNVSTSDYTYTYSVTNTGTEDLVIVTLPVFTPLGVNNIVSPTGFLLTFDPSQKVVNFIEDNNIGTPQTFSSGSTVGTFSFNTAVGPGGLTSFLAYDATGTEYSGLAIAPVPEPSSALFGGLAAALMITRRRRSA